MRFLYCGGGGGSGGGYTPPHKVKLFGWASRDGSGDVKKIVPDEWQGSLDETGRGRTPEQRERSAEKEAKDAQRLISEYKAQIEAQQLAQRRALVDRQRQQLVTSAQVNPLYTPASLGGGRKRKAPFSTPPITGERLG